VWNIFQSGGGGGGQDNNGDDFSFKKALLSRLANAKVGFSMGPFAMTAGGGDHELRNAILKMAQERRRQQNAPDSPQQAIQTPVSYGGGGLSSYDPMNPFSLSPGRIMANNPFAR
jgi:hypothetical protein